MQFNTFWCSHLWGDSKSLHWPQGPTGCTPLTSTPPFWLSCLPCCSFCLTPKFYSAWCLGPKQSSPGYPWHALSPCPRMCSDVTFSLSSSYLYSLFFIPLHFFFRNNRLPPSMLSISPQWQMHSIKGGIFVFYFSLSLIWNAWIQKSNVLQTTNS